MADIVAIISCLNNYLESSNQRDIGPVEANAVLATAGLLRDSKDRNGKPLRELLRDNKLSYAYQPGGIGGK